MTTLNEFINKDYCSYISLKRIKESNLRHDIGELKIICSYSISNKNIKKIKQIDIEELLYQIRDDRKVSDTTINRYRARLHAIFNYAINKGYIKDNPVTKIKKLKEFPRRVVLNYEQIEDLLYWCKDSVNHELYYIVKLAIYSGMRYSEILNMKKSRIEDNFYFIKAKENKSRSDRVIILHTVAVDLINEFMNKYPSDNDRIFRTKYIKRSYNTAIEKAGLQGVRFHDLRRTFATQLITSGADKVTVQKQLGHSSILMTERYIAPDLKYLVDGIEKLWFK